MAGLPRAAVGNSSFWPERVSAGVTGRVSAAAATNAKRQVTASWRLSTDGFLMRLVLDGLGLTWVSGLGGSAGLTGQGLALPPRYLRLFKNSSATCAGARW